MNASTSFTLYMAFIISIATIAGIIIGCTVITVYRDSIERHQKIELLCQQKGGQLIDDKCIIGKVISL